MSSKKTVHPDSRQRNDFQALAYADSNQPGGFFKPPANPYKQAKYCLAAGLVCGMIALPLFFIAPLPAALVFLSISLFFLATGLILAANEYAKQNKDASVTFNPGLIGFPM